MLGERAFASLAALPEVPEHAYIVTQTDAAVEAVEECGRLGVKVATVLADGFAEAGPAGLAREARLRDVVAKTGLRLVGPSSLGVVNLREGVMLTANAALDEKDLPVGRIFAGSHSGTHDRRAAHPRQGARHRLCRRGLGRQRGRSVARRRLRRHAR